jgi:hypothetical protein
MSASATAYDCCSQSHVINNAAFCTIFPLRSLPKNENWLLEKVSATLNSRSETQLSESFDQSRSISRRVVFNYLVRELLDFSLQTWRSSLTIGKANEIK